MDPKLQRLVEFVQFCLDQGIEVPRIQKGLGKMKFDPKLIDDAVVSALSRGHIPTDGTRFPMVEMPGSANDPPRVIPPSRPQAVRPPVPSTEENCDDGRNALPIVDETVPLIDAPALNLGAPEPTKILSPEQQAALQDLSISMSLATMTVAQPGLQATLKVESKPASPPKSIPKPPPPQSGEVTHEIELDTQAWSGAKAPVSSGSPFDIWAHGRNGKNASGRKRRLRLPILGVKSACALVIAISLASGPVGMIWPLIKPVFQGEISSIGRIKFRNSGSARRGLAGTTRETSMPQQVVTEDEEMRQLRELKSKSKRSGSSGS